MKPFPKIARILVLIAAFCLASVSVSAQVSEDVVLQWNRVLGQSLAAGVHPPTVLPHRSFAMVNLAMFDAVNSIDGSYNAYLTDVPGSKNASMKAAAAQAAHDVLSGLYPSRQAVYDEELAASIAGEQPQRAEQGQRVGRIVAANMLAERADDGWSAPWTPYSLPPLPGNWQGPTPFPGFAVFTNIFGVRPFGLTNGAQFMAPQPPTLASDAYAESYNDIKRKGSAAASPLDRTADQALSAFIWGTDPGFTDGKLYGLVFASSVEKNLTTAERARLCALAAMTFHDALQTNLTAQYTYGRWRPVTAIHEGDNDGNPNTIADPTWESLIGPALTPPHPSYPSNASAVSAAITKTLELFYQTDAYSFQIDVAPNGIRNYSSLSSLTNEIAHSRVFAGVHFPFEIAAGQKTGRDVASYIFYNQLTPRGKHR